MESEQKKSLDYIMNLMRDSIALRVEAPYFTSALQVTKTAKKDIETKE